jgi:precorrin-6Y C5,15-methyltransferase (decarboxylating) CbiT subunit
VIFNQLGAEDFTHTGDSDPAGFDQVIDGKTVRLTYGGAGHVMGTYRMGDDPKTSVVNSFQRSHDHANLYLVGSGTFPTVGTANPTITLSALAPRRGELLWDIGAGSGSIGIEWMLAHPSLRAIAIEANNDRAARIHRNAAHCGVPGLVVVEGPAPKALAGLATPDAIFIGGGGSDAGVLNAAIKALRAGGRLVANAVTLEMETLLLAQHTKRGGDLTRIAISRASPVGSMQAWRPAMPVTQWSWVKP